jgi:hypothetical protein
MPVCQDLPARREQLARELLNTGYICSCDDFCEVATFLQCCHSRDSILAMIELTRWPTAYAWLHARL